MSKVFAHHLCSGGQFSHQQSFKGLVSLERCRLIKALSGVARFFSVQNTKKGGNLLNDRKIDQMAK
jgi:hypothetical protein